MVVAARDFDTLLGSAGPLSSVWRRGRAVPRRKLHPFAVSATGSTRSRPRPVVSRAGAGVTRPYDPCDSTPPPPRLGHIF